MGCIKIHNANVPVTDSNINILKSFATPILLLSHAIENLTVNDEEPIEDQKRDEKNINDDNTRDGHHSFVNQGHQIDITPVRPGQNQKQRFNKSTNDRSKNPNSSKRKPLNRKAKYIVLQKIREHVHQLCLCEQIFLFSIQSDNSLKIEFESSTEANDGQNFYQTNKTQTKRNNYQQLSKETKLSKILAEECKSINHVFDFTRNFEMLTNKYNDMQDFFHSLRSSIHAFKD